VQDHAAGVAGAILADHTWNCMHLAAMHNIGDGLERLSRATVDCSYTNRAITSSTQLLLLAQLPLMPESVSHCKGTPTETILVA
jgi:hypothetical protein